MVLEWEHPQTEADLLLVPREVLLPFTPWLLCFLKSPSGKEVLTTCRWYESAGKKYNASFSILIHHLELLLPSLICFPGLLHLCSFIPTVVSSGFSFLQPSESAHWFG